MTRITDLATNDALIRTDVIPSVDKSDLSQGPGGSTKKITIEQLFNLLKTAEVDGGYPLTQDNILDGVEKVGYTTEEQEKLAALTDNLNISPFVQAQIIDGIPRFTLKGQVYRPLGFNWYPALIPTTTSANRKLLLDGARRVGANLIRNWCFDTPDAFRSLAFPPGPVNLITNYDFETDTTGWTLPGTVTRSNDVAHAGSWGLKQNQSYGSYDSAVCQITVEANKQYVWTFWYQATLTAGDGSHFLPRVLVGTTAGGEQITNGGILDSSPGVWKKKQVVFSSGNNTTLYLTMQNWGGGGITYYDDMDCSLKQTPVLVYNEDSFVRVDNWLDEARRRGIKVILCLADGNEFNYNTKGTYVNWANAVYNAGLSTAYPYVAFYTSSICKQLYKDFIDVITQRVNTVNGLVYKDDPTIFSWELGNELRINLFTSENGTQNTANSENVALMVSWATEMSSYIKSKDPNHLVGFGGMSHTWRWTSGDTIENGSGYGVDYRKLGAVPDIGYCDFHMYPTQDAQNSANYPSGEKDITSYGIRLTGHAPPIKQSSGSVTSYSVPLNEATQINDILVVHLVFSSALTPAPTITDNVGNTYNLTSSAADNKTHHYQGTQTVGGATQLNFSWSGARTVTAYVDEISGRDNGNNARTRAGLEAAMADMVTAAHDENRKPILCGEIGWASNVVRNNYHYPLYPRVNALSAWLQKFYDLGGDGVTIWHAVANETSGAFDIALFAHGGEAVVDDSDDTNIVALLTKLNNRLNGDVMTAVNELGTGYKPVNPRANILATTGTISVDPTFSELITITPSGDCTFNAASVSPPGTTLTFVITTSGTTSRTLTFGTNFKSTGTLATGTTSAKVFTITFRSDGSKWCEISRTTAM